MKKLLSFIFLLAAFCGFSQHVISTPTIQGYWDLNGNNTGVSNYLGTKTNQSLIFKTNGSQRFKIDSVGIFKFNGYAVNFGTGGTVSYTNTGWNITGNTLSNNTSYIGSSNAYGFAIKTNSVTAIRIDSSVIPNVYFNTSKAIFASTNSANGYLQFTKIGLNTVPATTGAGIRIAAGTTGQLMWSSQNSGSTDGYMRRLTGTLTGHRDYTMPDSSGRIVVTPLLTGKYVPYTGANAAVDFGSQTFSMTGAATFSNIAATGNLTVNGTSLLKGAVTTNTSITSTGAITTPTLYGSSAASGTLNIFGTSSATAGVVNLGLSGGTFNVNTGTANINSTVSIGSGTAIGTSSLVQMYVGKNNGVIGFGSHSAGYSTVWTGSNTASYDNTNYFWTGLGNSNYINSGGQIYFSIGGVPKHSITSTGFKLGSSAAASATLDVTGTMSVSSTATITGALNTSTVNSSGALYLGGFGNNYITLSGGKQQFDNTPTSIGSSPTYLFNGTAHYSITASTNVPAFKITGSTRGLLQGTVAAQYDNYLSANTYTGNAANTVLTNAYGLYVEKPIFSTNVSGTSLGIGTDGVIYAGGGLKGTTTNDAATAGNVGQTISSYIATGSAITLTTTVAVNITTISLTAGDWLVSGQVTYNETTATFTERVGSISQTGATILADGSECYEGGLTVAASNKNTLPLCSKRISLASTTTIYLVTKPTFSAGSATAFGFISALRVR